MLENSIKIEKIFSIRNIIIYLIIINLIGFYMMWSDKRKAKWGKWRIPEHTIAGMYTFHHKTKKLKFTVGLPTILILEIILVVYLKFF